MTDPGTIANFHAADNSASFKFNPRITGKADDANGRKDVEMMAPLHYLSSFGRTLKMPLINDEINQLIILTWFEKCVFNDTKATAFAINDTKLYAPVVTLSTQKKKKKQNYYKN